MKTKKKETYRNADDIDIAIRMAQVALARERQKMVSAREAADAAKALVRSMGTALVSEQLKGKYHAQRSRMLAQREIEEAAASRVRRIELKLEKLKAAAGIGKTETFSFVEDKAVTV